MTVASGTANGDKPVHGKTRSPHNDKLWIPVVIVGIYVMLVRSLLLFAGTDRSCCCCCCLAPRPRHP